MTKEDFIWNLEYLLKGRYVPLGEWESYIKFSELNNFELSGILELVKFCVTIKGNKIRREYIMKCLEEYNYRGIKNITDIRDYINKHKNINNLKNSSTTRRMATSRGYSAEELNTLFTKLEEVDI